MSMAVIPKTKALTLRLEPELHETITRMANHRNMSVNALVQQQLKQYVRIDDERTRHDSYTMLGQDSEECNVEYAIHAQAGVMLHD